MLKLWKLSLVSLLVSVLVLINIPINANLYINSLYRELNKRALVLYFARGMESLPGERFVVFYEDGQLTDAQVVLDAAEAFYPQLASDFGVEVRSRTPVRLHSDMRDINRSFGWPLNVNTMGVYWAGSIRVLAPQAWIGDGSEEELRALFMESGPMAHEIAHLFVDQVARGNCPRWFNEGVAQYQEYRLTGFHFGEARAFPSGLAYTLTDLEKFDALENQNRAYHQSFSMVLFLVESRGWPAVLEVLTELGTGRSLDEAFVTVTGSDLRQFFQAWQAWILE